MQDKAINIRFFYDIACVLDTHLRVRIFLAVLFELSFGHGTMAFLLVKRCPIVFNLSSL